MESQAKVRMIPVSSAEEAVTKADIIASSTSSMVPVIKKEWLKPGIHVSAIKKQEMNWETISQCDRFFLHTHRVMAETNYLMESDKASYPRGEKGWWHEKREEILVKKSIPDLGDLVAGRVPGRTSEDQSTGFLNNVGLGIQFAAVGAKIFDIAREQGLGREIPTDWFLETVHS
jgi:alanine dehydrogenase